MMKSSDDDLKKRGKITADLLSNNSHLPVDDLYYMLDSKVAVDRSIAILLLDDKIANNNIELVKILLKTLQNEKCLYTKLYISDILMRGNKDVALEMINYLGIIGSNQYHRLPDKVSMKKSYPLPRDIIARCLGKMNVDILPLLFEVLESNNEKQIVEVIDAIGFMLFYNQNGASLNYFNRIIETINKYRDNHIILYKCLICLSAFKNNQCQTYLQQYIDRGGVQILVDEAKRSRQLIINFKTL